jgi:hypothetical protein
MEEMFKSEFWEFNGDIGDWDIPDDLKLKTWVRNISGDPSMDRLPDKIVSIKTLFTALKNPIFDKQEIIKIIDEKDILEEDLLNVRVLLAITDSKKFKNLATNKEKKEYLEKMSKIKVKQKTLAKHMDLFNGKDSLIEKLSKCFINIKNKEEREMVITAYIVLPILSKMKTKKSEKC